MASFGALRVNRESLLHPVSLATSAHGRYELAVVGSRLKRELTHRRRFSRAAPFGSQDIEHAP